MHNRYLYVKLIVYNNEIMNNYAILKGRMKMKMKKIFALALSAVLVATTFTACGEASTLQKIKDEGKLVMYTNAAFPPFEYKTDGNTVAGVDVDIAQAIADEIGVELVVEDVEFDGIVLAVKNGQADLGIAGMTVRPDRQEHVDFSIPYTTSVQYIIVNKDNTEADSIEDLAGMTIGVQRGTTGDFIVSDEVNGYEDEDGNAVTGVLQDTGASVVTFRSAAEASLSLDTGKIDAIVVDMLPAKNVASENDKFRTFELVYADGSNTTEEYAIALAKGNDDLKAVVDEVIERLIADGTIEESLIHHSNVTINE